VDTYIVLKFQLTNTSRFGVIGKKRENLVPFFMLEKLTNGMATLQSHPGISRQI